MTFIGCYRDYAAIVKETSSFTDVDSLLAALVLIKGQLAVSGIPHSSLGSTFLVLGAKGQAYDNDLQD